MVVKFRHLLVAAKTKQRRSVKLQKSLLRFGCKSSLNMSQNIPNFKKDCR